MKDKELTKQEVRITKFQLNQEASSMLAENSTMPTKDVVECFNCTDDADYMNIFIVSEEQPTRFNGKPWTVKSIEKLRKWISYGRERDIVKFIREIITDHPNRKPTRAFISKVLREKYHVRRYLLQHDGIMIKASDIGLYLTDEKDRDLVCW